MEWKEGSFAGASESANAKYYQLVSDNPNKLVVAIDHRGLRSRTGGASRVWAQGPRASRVPFRDPFVIR